MRKRRDSVRQLYSINSSDVILKHLTEKLWNGNVADACLCFRGGDNILPHCVNRSLTSQAGASKAGSIRHGNRWSSTDGHWSNLQKRGDRILDTHAGSASCLPACHDAGIQYVGFEKDPRYFELADKRRKEPTAQITIFDMLDADHDEGGD